MGMSTMSTGMSTMGTNIITNTESTTIIITKRGA
jgi:hypothetical protein